MLGTDTVCGLKPGWLSEF